MKKVFKIIGSVAAICAGVAGGLFLYNKIKGNANAFDDDFDDDFDDYDDDFSDEEDEKDSTSYVDLNTASEADTKAED